MADEYTKPLPTPSANSQPFWNATKEHRLMFQRCSKCGTRVFYPRDVCPGPNCFGVGTLEWVESSGNGRVYSYTVTHHPHPAFADDAPFAIGVVEMDEGWRMMTNIVNIDPKDIRLGMRVGVVFDDVTPEITLPKFQPI